MKRFLPEVPQVDGAISLIMAVGVTLGTVIMLFAPITGGLT
jgi:hypothetical protein